LLQTILIVPSPGSRREVFIYDCCLLMSQTSRYPDLTRARCDDARGDHVSEGLVNVRPSGNVNCRTTLEDDSELFDNPNYHVSMIRAECGGIKEIEYNSGFLKV
jgi:hypothetical protein